MIECLPACLPACLPVCLPACLSVCLCVSVCLSVSVSVSLCLCACLCTRGLGSQDRCCSLASEHGNRAIAAVSARAQTRQSRARESREETAKQSIKSTCCKQQRPSVQIRSSHLQGYVFHCIYRAQDQRVCVCVCVWGGGKCVGRRRKSTEEADDQVKTGQTNLYCASGAAAGCERSRSLSVALQGAIRAGSEKSPGSSSEKQHQSRGDKRENQVR